MYKVALVYQLRNADFFRRGGKLGYPEKRIQHHLHESHKTTLSLTADRPIFLPVGCQLYAYLVLLLLNPWSWEFPVTVSQLRSRSYTGVAHILFCL